MEQVESLLERTLEGDIEAFGQVVDRFQDMAFGCAYAILGDFHLAEDAAQEAFFTAYRTLDNLKQLERFPRWLRRIVVGSCDRIMRHRKAPPFRSVKAGNLSPRTGTPPISPNAQR